MTGTKIINVLQDDSFEAILNIFNGASAQEVIFVLPKKHEALNSDDHFAILAQAAQNQEKKVMILAQNPEVNELALQYNFAILTSARSSSRAVSKKEQKKEPEKAGTKTKKIEITDDDNSDIGERNLDELEEAEVEEPDVETDEPGSKMMTDILVPSREEEQVSVKISKKREPDFEIEVNHDQSETALDQIQSVWKSRPSSDSSRELLGVNKNRPEFSPRFRFSKKFSLAGLSRRSLVILGSSVAVLFFIILFVSIGSAQIFIKPRVHSLDFNLNVSASDKFLTVNLDDKRIPGQLFLVEKTVEQTFSATGERDVVQKARGKVTVYNEYGTAPQVLIATTRFESEGGLIFRTLKNVTVPGTKVVNGEIFPGIVEVEVIADKAGDGYNIGPGKFTVPAFKEKGDSDRYQKFYATSKEPMKGGIVGKAKIVTDQDYMKAKEEVHSKVVSEIQADLKVQGSELKILDSLEPVSKELTSTAEIDEAAENFTVRETAVLEAVGFKESDLYNLIGMYIDDINQLEVLPEKLNVEYSNVVLRGDTKVLGFTVFVKGPAYSRVDKEKITSDLIGKNEQEIKDYVKGIEGVSSARVVLSPFWVRRVPDKLDRIKFELQYE